ncbi:hypothetical protein GO730_00615 [Spirosoma sp. HMF3257]|uniref:Uncharacterized protein n=1 Tax=Spirosoma telluris TaxID=2183553 RepID=A0A327NDX5_9BACT|nr:hypothetical protein [Spirosoma telluris]RAI73302.1 hypothetical protein HMF3257_00600 [Spirosoma telluris]
MDSIQKTISSESITGFNRVARHENFVILSDLNMVQQIRVVTLDEQGLPILERIGSDEHLTPAQKQAALLRYQDQIVTRNTGGSFVDPKTGKVVDASTEGAVPQREFFQGITLGSLKAMGLSITDKTSVASLIYALIGNAISDIDLRGEL